MYESYWKLNRKPFESGADPRMYYPAEAHQGALVKLRYVIEHQRGGALVAGGSGCGKTLVLRLLADQLPEQFTPWVHLVFPQMPTADLLEYLAGELGAPGDPDVLPSVAQSVGRIQRLLAENTSEGRQAVVVIDDAHLLEESRTLEALRLLLNFETAGRAGLTLLLVGQPSVWTALERMPQLEERLGVKCVLGPFTLDETTSYVQHRLQAAGATRSIFEPAALEALYYLSQGVPRRINRLCDLALVVGFAEELRTLGAAQVEAVAQQFVGAAPE